MHLTLTKCDQRTITELRVADATLKATLRKSMFWRNNVTKVKFFVKKCLNRNSKYISLGYFYWSSSVLEHAEFFEEQKPKRYVTDTLPRLPDHTFNKGTAPDFTLNNVRV